MRSDARGIVLLEILIALVVMGIGSIAVLQALSFLVRQDDRVRLRAQAELLADNIYYRYAAGELPERRGEDAREDGRMAWQLDSGTAVAGIEPISISVTWQGKNRSFSLLTTRLLSQNTQ
jgi:Tfp pilus assembly protein PilV